MKLKHKYEAVSFTYALLHERDFDYAPIIELFETQEEARERLEDIVTAYFEENGTNEDDRENTLDVILDYGEARLGDVCITLLDAENVKRVD